jgi:two-component system, response regulator PdtaR
MTRSRRDLYRDAPGDRLIAGRPKPVAALSVLVVEDDAVIGMLLAEMLEYMGYDVCTIAATEEDAVADATRRMPDLMIVDEHLREGSGVAAVQRILQTGPVPCVFISGAPMYPRRPDATVLQKPFAEADLVRAIRYVVGNAAVPAALMATPSQVGLDH